MANIKSAQKRISVIAKRTEINKSNKTKMKTMIRKFNEAVLASDKEAAQTSFFDAEKVIRKTASKGSIHKNAADRKVSRLAKKLSSLA